MDKKRQYLFFIVLAILLITNREQICRHLGFGQTKSHGQETFTDTVTRKPDTVEQLPAALLMNDSVFSWDDRIYDFVAVRRYNPLKDEGNPFAQLASNKSSTVEAPTKVTWRTLTRIKYVLKYFEELGMEMYAPVFSDTLKKLDRKLVEVEGFFIPFDQAGTAVALSANPYAACFFCGKASPASVMSLKFARSGKKYKMDEFLKFTGRLRLNYDDPNEFYYVLEEAKEQ